MDKQSYANVLEDLTVELSKLQAKHSTLQKEMITTANQIDKVQVGIELLKMRMDVEELFEDISDETPTETFQLQPQNLQRERPFRMTQAIRDEFPAFFGHNFVPSELFQRVHEKYPSDVPLERRRSFNSTLNNLVIQGELEKVREGSFDIEPVYRIRASV